MKTIQVVNDYLPPFADVVVQDFETYLSEQVSPGANTCFTDSYNLANTFTITNKVSAVGVELSARVVAITKDDLHACLIHVNIVVCCAEVCVVNWHLCRCC